MREILMLGTLVLTTPFSSGCSPESTVEAPVEEKKPEPTEKNNTEAIKETDLLLGQAATDALKNLPHSLSLEVLDTISSLGPLGENPRRISFDDLVRYHGHPCDGLVIAAAGMAYGLRSLFPTGSVDRTDLIAVTNGSPCYGDAAEYITGTRVRYGTLTIDNTLGDEWIIGQRSTNKFIRVFLREGIKPGELVSMEGRLKGLDCPADLIRDVQKIQWELSKTIFTTPPEKLFLTESVDKFSYPVEGNRPDVQKRHCPPIKSMKPANR